MINVAESDSIRSIAGVMYESRFGVFIRIHDEWQSVRDLQLDAAHLTEETPIIAAWFCHWTVPGMKHAGQWIGPHKSERAAIQAAEDDFMGDAAELVPELPARY